MSVSTPNHTKRKRPEEESGLPAAKRTKVVLTGDSLRIKFKSVVWVRKLFKKFVLPLRDDVSIMCDATTMKIQAQDLSHTSLAEIQIPHTYAEVLEYVCERTMPLCFSVKTLVSFLDFSKLDAPLLIETRYGSDKIGVTILHAPGGQPKANPALRDGGDDGEPLYPKHLLSVINMDMGLITTVQPRERIQWQTRARGFHDILKKFHTAKAMKLFFNVLVAKRTLLLSGDMENGHTKWPLPMTAINNTYEDERETLSQPYATKLLVKLIEGCSMVRQLTLTMAKDQPLCLIFQFDKDTWVNMYLAPSVNDADFEDDEEE